MFPKHVESQRLEFDSGRGGASVESKSIGQAQVDILVLATLVGINQLLDLPSPPIAYFHDRIGSDLPAISQLGQVVVFAIVVGYQPAGLDAAKNSAQAVARLPIVQVHAGLPGVAAGADQTPATSQQFRPHRQNTDPLVVR